MVKADRGSFFWGASTLWQIQMRLSPDCPLMLLKVGWSDGLTLNVTITLWTHGCPILSGRTQVLQRQWSNSSNSQPHERSRQTLAVKLNQRRRGLGALVPHGQLLYIIPARDTKQCVVEKNQWLQASKTRATLVMKHGGVHSRWSLEEEKVRFCKFPVRRSL